MSNQFEIFDQYDQIKESKLHGRKRWIILGMFVIGIIITGGILIKILPKKDKIESKNIPDTYLIENKENFVAFQSGNDCAGYATAYAMRHLGINVEGAALYKEFSQFFGKVALHNIVKTLDEYQISGKAYYGTIETLKAELLKGVPVIALIKINVAGEWGLHYVAVVGYDKEYVYLADSTKPKTNIQNNTMYNRKLSYTEFQELWDTEVYPMKNCYIVVERNIE